MAYDTALVLGTSIGALVFAYFGIKIKGDKHFALQTLFIFGSIILLINSGGIMREIVTVDSIGGNVGNLVDQYVMTLSVVLWVAVAYHIVFYMWSVLEWLNTVVTGKDDKKGKRVGSINEKK